jgi:DNA-directed RNA polymerase specialized sigma24 family protein
MTTAPDPRAALAEFYRRRRPYVAVMARRLARQTGDDADELIGAAWLHVVRYADRLAAAEWDMGLFITMTRRAMWRASNQSRRARGMASLDAAEFDPADRREQPADELIRAEQLARLRPAVAELSDLDRAALAGHYGLDGRAPMSAADMVQLLGKRCRRTAQYTIQQARRRLKEKMGE